MNKHASSQSVSAPPPYKLTATPTATPTASQEQLYKSCPEDVYDEWLLVTSKSKKQECDSNSGVDIPMVKLAQKDETKETSDDDDDEEKKEDASLKKAVKKAAKKETVEKLYTSAEVYEMMVRQQRRMKIEHISVIQRFLFLALGFALGTVILLTMMAIYHDTCLSESIREFHERSEGFKSQLGQLEEMTNMMKDKMLVMLGIAKDVYLEDCEDSHPLKIEVNEFGNHLTIDEIRDRVNSIL